MKNTLKQRLAECEQLLANRIKYSPTTGVRLAHSEAHALFAVLKEAGADPRLEPDDVDLDEESDANTEASYAEPGLEG